VSLVGDFKGAGARNLLVDVRVGRSVGDEVTVEIVREVRLGDLVTHRDRIGDTFNDGSGD
jgi:hypothetical protein